MPKEEKVQEEKGVDYRVIKNTLMALALDKAGKGEGKQSIAPGGALEAPPGGGKGNPWWDHRGGL